eukprot:Pgem_evm1s11923
MATPMVAGALAIFAEKTNLRGSKLQNELLKHSTKGKLHGFTDNTVNSLLFVPGELNDLDNKNNFKEFFESFKNIYSKLTATERMEVQKKIQSIFDSR